MSRGLWLPSADSLDPATASRDAERLGYDSLWVGELWGADAFVRLTRAAVATDRIRLGTAIVNVYSRTPAAIAMAAASVQRAAGGRFRLGLGPGSRPGVEGIHGLAFDRPATRLDEVGDAIRRLTAGGDPVTLDGEVVSVSGVPPLDVDLPLYAAALGSGTRRVVGRRFDAWLPHLLPLRDLEDAFEPVAAAARDADRDPGDIAVVPYVPTAVDDDPEAARRRLAGHVAYYVGSADGYRRAVASRFPDAVERVTSTWRDGDRDAARDAVTPGMVDELGVAGDPTTVRERLAALEDRDRIDDVIVVTAGRADRDHFDRVAAAASPQSVA